MDKDFQPNILNIKINDKVGIPAKTDSIILMIGSQFYGKVKRKFDKKLEVEKSVRFSMRCLENICKRFKAEKQKGSNMNMSKQEQGNCGDMF